MIVSRKKAQYSRCQIRTLIYTWITTHHRLPHVTDFGPNAEQVGVGYSPFKHYWTSLNDLWHEAVRDEVATNRMLSEAIARRGKNRGHRPTREIIAYKNVLFAGDHNAPEHE